MSVALVTGASSGIGEAIALRLAALGYTTYGAARHVERMSTLKQAGGIPLKLDFTDPASIKSAVDTILAEGGGVDILVNVGGTALYGAVEQTSMEDARRIFEVNLFGSADLIRQLTPQMRERRSGTIINVTSVGGVAASPYGAWYHATKFAFEGFSSSLRQELNPFGVDVVIIRPEAIKSGWRGVAGETLLANSGEGPYVKATKAAYAKYMSPAFDKMLSDPKVVADLVERILKTKRPKSVYMVPFMANVTLTLVALLWSDRWRDAFIRKFIGLPKTM
jgi:NAD(P)-dependent dehydrogenase (short-subunit alcohol dehydrogenase family)